MVAKKKLITRFPIVQGTFSLSILMALYEQ